MFFVLEKFGRQDGPLYDSLVFNQEAMNMNLGRVFTRAEADFFFAQMLAGNEAQGIGGYYKVLAPEGAAVLGMFGITENADGAMEIEYLLLPEHWGKGYGTQLVKEQVKRLRACCPGRTIQAITDPKNKRSIRVLERNGFRKVREFYNGDGEPAVLYGLAPLK